MARKDISFTEMAHLALHFLMDPHTAEHDPDSVMAILFKLPGYQKRSYIRNFNRLVLAFGEALKHPRKSPRPMPGYYYRGRTEGLGHAVHLERVGRAAPLCGAGE